MVISYIHGFVDSDANLLVKLISKAYRLLRATLTILIQGGDS